MNDVTSWVVFPDYSGLKAYRTFEAEDGERFDARDVDFFIVQRDRRETACVVYALSWPQYEYDKSFEGPGVRAELAPPRVRRLATFPESRGYYFRALGQAGEWLTERGLVRVPQIVTPDKCDECGYEVAEQHWASCPMCSCKLAKLNLGKETNNGVNSLLHG